MAYCEDGYLWPQEHTTYDLVGYRDSVSFSGYESYDLDTYNASYTLSEFHQPKSVDPYHLPHSLDDYDYDYSRNSNPSASPDISYFAYNYAEPKLISYEPVSCDTGYVYYHTQYSISYSKIDSTFNEPEFEEYDPTPYDGGYDIVSVYGKPLPPSDQTCYPRSNPKSVEPRPPVSQPELRSPESRSKPVVPIPIPLVDPKPDLNHEPTSKPEPEPVSPPNPIPTTGSAVESEPVHVMVPIGEREREKEEYSYPGYGFDYPWPEYDHGYGIGVGYDYGYGKQMIQVPPCEYNPEDVDLFENIFGNWPCLARIRKQQMSISDNAGVTGPENGHHTPWEECGNYIFGRPIASYNQ